MELLQGMIQGWFKMLGQCGSGAAQAYGVAGQVQVTHHGPR